MTKNDQSASVMVISQTDKAYNFLKRVMPQDQFYPIISMNSAGEAQRYLINRSVDIVVINAPLKDASSTELAIDISQNSGCGVLLMVKAEIYDHVTYQVENYGILTLSRPCTSKDIFQSLKLLLATQARLRKLERRTANLEEKMEEIRLVNRAKGLLMDHLKMTEAEAHRYIEKAAMDNCEKKSTIARNLIKTYGN